MARPLPIVVLIRTPVSTRHHASLIIAGEVVITRGASFQLAKQRHDSFQSFQAFQAFQSASHIKRPTRQAGSLPHVKEMPLSQEGTFRRRRLPHWDVPGVPVFITACLAGSISSVGLSRIRRYRDELENRARPVAMQEVEWAYHKEKLMFRKVDDLLDYHSSARHLDDERQARIVRDAFLHFADERYKLLAFVVMPSHHHWVFLPDEDWARTAVLRAKESGHRKQTPREIISHAIQSYTGTMCNRIRARKEPIGSKRLLIIGCAIKRSCRS